MRSVCDTRTCMTVANRLSPVAPLRTVAPSLLLQRHIAELADNAVASKTHETATIEREKDGKVHGRPLPNAEDIHRDDVEDAISELKGSIKAREEENERFPRGNRNGSQEERDQHRRFRNHQDRIQEEKKLVRQLEKRLEKQMCIGSRIAKESC